MLTILVVGRAKAVERTRATSKSMVIGDLPANFTHSLDKVLRFGFSTGNKTKAPKSVTVHLIKFDVLETNCKTCKMFWRITLMWTGEAANKPCKE